MVEDKNLEKTIEESYPNDAGLCNGSKQYQHQNSDFRNSAVTEKDRTRHCASSLFTRKHTLSGELFDLSWLCYSERQRKLYCFICKLFSKTNNKFTNVFNNCRKADEKIDKHSKSQSHREALADAVVRSKISSRIDRQLVPATELESKYWHEVLRPMIDVIASLSTRGLALRGHDEVIDSFQNGNFLGIIELLSKCDPFLATHIEKYGNKAHGSTPYLSHSICDELINIMAKSVIRIIVKEVQESRYFSISVDSTPE